MVLPDVCAERAAGLPVAPRRPTNAPRGERRKGWLPNVLAPRRRVWYIPVMATCTLCRSVLPPPRPHGVAPKVCPSFREGKTRRLSRCEVIGGALDRVEDFVRGPSAVLPEEAWKALGERLKRLANAALRRGGATW